MNTHSSSPLVLLEESEEFKVEETTDLSEVAFPLDSSITYYKIWYNQYYLLFHFHPRIMQGVEGLYEIHIACPKHSIVASRVLALGAMCYLYAKYPEVQSLLTTAPRGKIANMIRKIGGMQIASINNLLYFISRRDL